MAKSKGYFGAAWNITDMWQQYIRQLGRSNTHYGGDGYRELYDGTWRGVVDVWKRVMTNLARDNTNVPFIYLKDEWDHENQWWGSYEEQVRELRYYANSIVPGVPTVVTTMGWKPLMMQAAVDLADVQMADRYPEKTNLQEIAVWAEEMRRVANGKAFMSVLPLKRSYENPRNDPTQWNRLDYLQPGVYMSLTHGGRGVWFFGDPCGMTDSACSDYHSSLKPLMDEIKSLSDVIHGSATELGRTVATTNPVFDYFPLTYVQVGDGTSATDGVSTVYRQSSSRKVLMTVNEWNEPLTARLNVASVKAGDVVTVLFENRTIIADQDGSFQDTFAPFERHVYQIRQ